MCQKSPIESYLQLMQESMFMHVAHLIHECFCARLLLCTNFHMMCVAWPCMYAQSCGHVQRSKSFRRFKNTAQLNECSFIFKHEVYILDKYFLPTLFIKHKNKLMGGVLNNK